MTRAQHFKNLLERLEGYGYKVVCTPRAQLGWPCFHCGTKLDTCKALGELTKGDRCCKQCKGKASH